MTGKIYIENWPGRARLFRPVQTSDRYRPGANLDTRTTTGPIRRRRQQGQLRVRAYNVVVAGLHGQRPRDNRPIRRSQQGPTITIAVAIR